MRDSFVFYRSFYEALVDLPKDIQGEVFTAIMEYSLNGVITENLTPVARSIFTLMRPQIDANNQRYMNGCKGGRPRKEETEPKPNVNQNETEPKPNDNDNDNDNDITTTTTDVVDGSSSVESNITTITKRLKTRTREKAPAEPMVVDLQACTVTGGEWRTDFKAYQSGLRECFKALRKDEAWMAERKRLNPGVNVALTLEKVCVEFWSTEAGWERKRKSKSKSIDWRATLTTSVGAKFNRVYDNGTGTNQTGQNGGISAAKRADILRRLGGG